MAANTARHLTVSLGPGAPLAGTPYRIVRVLGTGAMGEVYEAEHTLLGTRRALKVLAPQHAERADLAERMRVEARALAKLRHKNLVEVLDLGVSSDGRPFFAMEVLEGHTLRQTLRANGALRVALGVEVAIEILEGLGAAHASGLVHRDIKPENVFVCATGAIKVLDFGIAKFSDLAGAPVTQTGFTIGTPRYMAPEQIEGKAVDARTDVYATAIVLYEMTTGSVPFEDAETMALAYAHVQRPPPPPSSRAAQEVTPRLEAAILRALSKKPDDRFANASEFAAELRRCSATHVTTAVELRAAIAKVESTEARVEVTVATSGEKPRVVASGVRARDDESAAPSAGAATQRTALIAGLFVLSLSLAALAAAVVWLARSQHSDAPAPVPAAMTAAQPAANAGAPQASAVAPAASPASAGTPASSVSTPAASTVAPGGASAARAVATSAPATGTDAPASKHVHSTTTAPVPAARPTRAAQAPAATAEPAAPSSEKPALPGPGF